MEISGKDIKLPCSNGKFKKIQDIVVGDCIVLANGENLKVTHVSTDTVTMNPILFMGNTIYLHQKHEIPLLDTETNSVFSYAIKDLMTFSPDRSHKLKLMIKPLQAFDHKLSIPKNIGVFGKWMATSRTNIPIFLKKRKKEKSSLLYELINKFKLDVYNPSVPEDIIAFPLESRLSFLRGFIDFSAHKVQYSKDEKTYKLIISIDNFLCTETMIKVFRSVGYKATSPISCVIQVTGLRKQLKYLINGNILNNMFHTEPLTVMHPKVDLCTTIQLDGFTSNNVYIQDYIIIR